MAVKVGIPRALLYYHYFPMWNSFFRALGAEVVVSGPSTKSVLNRGVQLCVEDACLPVKLAIGHVAELVGRVDYLFLPRLVSVAAREYICPKFLGFPDMVRQTFQGLPGIIDVNVNLYRRENGLYGCFREVGKFFTASTPRVYLAYRKGLAALKNYRNLLDKGYMPEEAMHWQEKNTLSCFRGKTKEALERSSGMSKITGIIEEKPTVAVIGHPYNIYDSFINMNILKRLRQAGVKIITTDQVPEGVVRQQAACLSKRLFWTLSQQIIGAAFYFLEQGECARGLLHITSFGCGPDSMTGELIAKRVRQTGTVPLLNLVLDEHTGEAGVLTRLEAFLDMVDYRMSKKLRA